MFRKDTWSLQDPGASDLWKDPLVRFQHRFYLPVAIPMAFGVPMAIASFWGDPWGGLLIAGLARIVVNQHLTFAINSVCHSIGEQPYSDRHTARDNWVTAVFTYGEGYHNFHHEFASDYRNGLKVYAWDPTKWLIYSLWKMRLVSEVRVTDAGIIAAKKARMQAIRLAKAAAAAGSDLAHAPTRAHGMLTPMIANSMASSGKG
jgi:stearoyl-CoA desaturase (delta-9 desaturase)